MINVSMVMSTADQGAARGLPDRRDTNRFPVREEVRYKVLQSRDGALSGSGHTLNFGSGGILFTTQEQLPVGRAVQVAVDWPARLGGTCPLKFIAVGRIVRADAHTAAIRIDRYEFKTRGLAAVTSASGNLTSL